MLQELPQKWPFLCDVILFGRIPHELRASIEVVTSINMPARFWLPLQMLPLQMLVKCCQSNERIENILYFDSYVSLLFSSSRNATSGGGDESNSKFMQLLKLLSHDSPH